MDLMAELWLKRLWIEELKEIECARVEGKSQSCRETRNASSITLMGHVIFISVSSNFVGVQFTQWMF